MRRGDVVVVIAATALVTVWSMGTHVGAQDEHGVTPADIERGGQTFLAKDLDRFFDIPFDNPSVRSGSPDRAQRNSLLMGQTLSERRSKNFSAARLNRCNSRGLNRDLRDGRSFHFWRRHFR